MRKRLGRSVQCSPIRRQRPTWNRPESPPNSKANYGEAFFDSIGQTAKSVFLLNVVDGCMPSDLGVGTSAEIEEERRLLYVAMTRAKDDLHLVVPQRFFTHGQHSQGDRHVYASRTRFIPDRLLGLFEKTVLPLAVAGASARAASQGQRIDVGARMRGMWR